MIEPNRIDLLGASADALSMIFELIWNHEELKKTNLRIIKNTNHALDRSFEIKNMTYEIAGAEEVKGLAEHLFLGVYKSETKKAVYKFFTGKHDIAEEQFINLIHPNSVVANTVRMGNGIQINPLTTVGPHAMIGNFTTINRNASIGHHTKIGSFCTVNPGVHVAGHCDIEDNVTLGMGALILDGKKIGKNSVVAAGALVTKDIPENVLAMGAPAKVVKEL
ncbi:acetyltransferase [Ekhidna sp.]|uniref:acetyltransferase n=1 Tax=Ekhidna sp. TaxID=2608089 RepID=UPI003B59AAF7